MAHFSSLPKDDRQRQRPAFFTTLTPLFAMIKAYRIAAAALLVSLTPSLPAADFTWDGGDGAWNLTNPNWNGGGLWVNGAGNNAIIEGDAPTVSLTQDITAGKVIMDPINGTAFIAGAAGLVLTASQLGEGSLIFFNAREGVTVRVVGANGIGNMYLYFYENSVLDVAAANVMGAGSGEQISIYESATIRASATGAMNGGNVFLNEDALFDVTAANATGAGTKLRFYNEFGGSGGTLRLNGNSTTFGTVSSTAEFVAGVVENASATAATLTIDQSAAADPLFNDTFRGLIQDGAGGGALSIVKTGGRSYTLFGANTYTGSTTVNGGTLFVRNTTGSATGTGEVIVNNGATLSGDGAVSGAVTINDGGHLTPGNGGAGSLSVGALTLTNGAILDFEFGLANAPGNPLNDVVDVTGDLTLDGILNVGVSAGGTFGPGLYRIFSYTGALTDNGVTFGTVPGVATDLVLQTSIDGQVNLINTLDLVLNFWDGDNVANFNNGVVNGGTGTWILNSPNDDWTDENGVVNVPYENGQFVIFQGDAGTVTVDNTNGAVTFGGAQFAVDGYTLTGDDLAASGANTVIRVGDGTVAGADFTATISAAITGATTLEKADLGTLVLTAANTYTNGTVLTAGTLVTQNISALGTGTLTLDGGIFNPQTALTTGGLTWNNGGILLSLDPPVFHLTGDLINGSATPKTFILEQDGLTPLAQLYTLLTFDGVTNFTSDDFAAVLTSGNPNVTLIANFLVNANDVQLSLGAIATGPLLQNSAPVSIPEFADFFVNGVVTTGTPAENNVIRSLTFANGSSLEVFNNLEVTSGNLTVTDGVATIFGDSVSTPGDLNKLGLGTLILDAVLATGGTANIVQGAMLVNGILATDALTVFQNALLGGSGVINGNVVNSGVVSPGNSPGVLTINGNFTQNAEGTLLIELASTSVFDQLVVNGNAALAGTLQIESFGGFVPQYGQQFDFLQATSISGEFDTIALPAPELFRGRLLVDDGVGTLLIAPTSYTLVAATQNQFNVAQALDSFISATSGDREMVSIALDLQSAAEYPAAFDAIAPTFYESLANITLEQTNAQNQLIAQRLSAVRLGSRGFSAVGIEAPLVNDKNGKNVMDAKEGKDILTPTVDNKWGVWVQGNGIFSKVTNVSQVPNYRFNSGGFLLGADYKWSENFTTGVYAGYQGTYAKYADDSNLRVNSALFGGYATYDNGGFYADAIVGGGYTNYTAKRAINFSTIDRVARSQPGGGQFTTYLDAGYDWEVKGFTFGPIVSGQYTYAGIAPFTESGADSLDLKVSQQNANSIRTNIGGRVAYTWNVTSSITFIPEVRMFWQHEFLNNPRNIASSLDGGSGPGFGYETSAPARDSVFAGAGISARFGDRWDAYVYYNADFGRQDYLSHIVSAGLGFKF